MSKDFAWGFFTYFLNVYNIIKSRYEYKFKIVKCVNSFGNPSKELDAYVKSYIIPFFVKIFCSVFLVQGSDSHKSTIILFRKQTTLLLEGG